MNQPATPCPNCHGKGHVMDGMAALIFLPLAWFERNDRRGITRDKCQTCDGKGFIEIKPDRKAR
jgi:DnaJ-class molecular chaperone